MIMKKYLKLILVGSLVVFTSSCDERLNLEPLTQVPVNGGLSNPNDFENAVKGQYTRFRAEAYYSGNLISFPDVQSDNLTFKEAGRGTQRVAHEWRYNSNSTQGGLLGTAYRIIQQSNIILENIDVLQDGDFKNNIIGEALATRALAHFDAVKTFAAIPSSSPNANQEPALPYMTDSDINQSPSRIPVGEFYDNLVNDLTTALPLINANNGPGRLNKNGVNALLSRLYLYMGRWQDAVNAADAVTTPTGSRADFTGIWNDSNTSDIIFDIKLNQVNPETPGVPYNQTLPAGIRSEYVCSFQLFQLYQNSDIRKSAYITTAPFDGNQYNHVRKWLSSVNNTATGRVNVKVLRKAEVLLNKAEALANLNQDAQALAALDELRQNRYLPFVSGGETGQALKDAIQLERRLELAFEGHRFFDLKRQNLPVQRGPFGDFADGTGLLPFEPLLPAGDCRFNMPIPQLELNINPNITQNDCSFY